MAKNAKDPEDIEIVDEKPEIEAKDEPKVEVVAESKPKSEVKSDQEGIAELKKRLQETEEAKNKAERERNEAVQRAYQAKNEKEDTDLRLIEGAKAQVLENSKLLKQQYAHALATQDFERAADIQEAIAANQAKALQLENGAQSLKERPKETPRPLDPVEAMASQLSPQSAAWVRAHPEFATNPRLTQKMIAAHNLAMADGHSVDTPGYFESVEDTLKIAQRAPTRAVQDEDGEEVFSDASRPSTGRQTAPAAIPVSRETTPSGQRQRTVRLSQQEVEAAEMSGLTPAEYYANKMALRSERLN